MTCIVVPQQRVILLPSRGWLKRSALVQETRPDAAYLCLIHVNLLFSHHEHASRSLLVQLSWRDDVYDKSVCEASEGGVTCDFSACLFLASSVHSRVIQPFWW